MRAVGFSVLPLLGGAGFTVPPLMVCRDHEIPCCCQDLWLPPRSDDLDRLLREPSQMVGVLAYGNLIFTSL